MLTRAGALQSAAPRLCPPVTYPNPDSDNDFAFGITVAVLNFRPCAYTGCGKLTSFFICIYSYKKGSYLAALCILCPYLSVFYCRAPNE
jgi:hypothetical protein